MTVKMCKFAPLLAALLPLLLSTSATPANLTDSSSGPHGLQRLKPNPAGSSSAEIGETTNLESRSNFSASAEHPPLFADRHNGDLPASAINQDQDHDAGSVAAESSLHEHVEKYQLHQGSEEDDEADEPSHLSAMANSTRPKVAKDSVQVSSDSFPVRVGPGSQSGPNSNWRKSNSSGVGVGIRKPLPVIRHEGSIIMASERSDDEEEVDHFA